MSVIAQPYQPTAINTASMLKQAKRGQRAVTTAQCLVLSVHPDRREMLVRSANDAGWDTVACADAQVAWQTAQRERFAMALVDLESADQLQASYRDLAEHIIKNQQTLMVVCGHEEDTAEELWARQAGAWLYLPGVSANCNIRDLCQEAWPVAEKLHRLAAATTPTAF